LFDRNSASRSDTAFRISQLKTTEKGKGVWRSVWVQEGSFNNRIEVKNWN